MLFTTRKGTEYIGHTIDLERRIFRHNGFLKNKRSSYTSKNSGEWVLVYKESFNIRKEAVKREKELKSYQGRKFIRKVILKRGMCR